ncbi:hypothetical protein DAEQUDRAFT_151245 [Daedalea quercina L-15889]|uniref:Uncharacterized protein n=1 Tax=Daedalea quercina L-15889 TaxID=1314783 RepID=A0A165RLA1_9APHY|nr:hypothetical protein DAEQUDRAFT_151245 [Daedalea quercina L-15889]
MLMRKDIAWLWAECRQNVEGLPDCPLHLSEPAYADLVFNKRCHGCSKAGVAKVIWEASARYCDECVRVQMVGVRHFFKDPANSVYSRFKKLVLTVTVDSRLSFHKPDLLRLYSIWVGMEEHGSWQDFVMEQNGRLEVLRAHVEACQEWKRSIDVVRTEELQSIRDQRVSFIKARLLELGYPEATVEAAEAKLQTSKQVRVSKPLDDKGWSRICAQLVSFMDDFEQSQVCEDRIQKFADILDEVRKDNLHDPDIRWWPGTADLLLMQGTSYRARLTSGPLPVNVSDYLELKAQIRRDIGQWLENKREELEETVRDMKEDFFPIGIRAIDLVVCVFYCDSCHQRIRFPEILVHRCLRGLMYNRYRVLEQEIQQREDLFEKAVLETCGYCPWSLTCYVRYLKQKRHPQQTILVSLVSDIDHGLINTIIMCGKDPFYTKWDEMDKRNPVFSLRNTNITAKVMGWRCAVSALRSVPVFTKYDRRVRRHSLMRCPFKHGKLTTLHSVRRPWT